MMASAAAKTTSDPESAPERGLAHPEAPFETPHIRPVPYSSCRLHQHHVCPACPHTSSSSPWAGITVGLGPRCRHSPSYLCDLLLVSRRREGPTIGRLPRCTSKVIPKQEIRQELVGPTGKEEFWRDREYDSGSLTRVAYGAGLFTRRT